MPVPAMIATRPAAQWISLSSSLFWDYWGLCAVLVLTSRGMLFPARDEIQQEVVTHHLQFAGRSLRVRETWLVARSHAPGEPRLSLRVPLEDILPDRTRHSDAVTIALTPEDASLHPADLPRMLYARFLASEAKAVPGNLVRRPFHADSPYAGEVLLIAPPEGRHFSATLRSGRFPPRCRQAVSPRSAVPASTSKSRYPSVTSSTGSVSRPGSPVC